MQNIAPSRRPLLTLSAFITILVQCAHNGTERDNMQTNLPLHTYHMHDMPSYRGDESKRYAPKNDTLKNLRRFALRKTVRKSPANGSAPHRLCKSSIFKSV